MSTAALKSLCTTREAARRLRTSVGALKLRRHRGDGPAFVKVKHAVFYERDVVEAWRDKSLKGNRYARSHKYSPQRAS